MQSLTVATGPRNPNGASATKIRNVLTGRYGSRRWSFRYELLSNTHVRIMDLADGVITATVQMDYFADIKRKATFTIRDRGEINYLSDRIRPHVRLHLPPYGTGDYVEWPQGVFLLSSPTRNADEVDIVTRNVEAYDPLQALMDDAVSARYAVAAGANVVTAAKTVAAGAVPSFRVTASSETLTALKEWPPGTSKLTICNELLHIAEYDSLFFDEDGVGVLRPYVEPSLRPEEWTYAYGDESLIIPEIDQELDLFSVPNKWVLVVSEPDQTMLTATYTNTNPASPTSTVRRGRTIVDFRDQEEASSQTVLNNKAKRYALEASQVYEHLDFQTALMPIHTTNDIYHLAYNPLAIDTKYQEMGWEMTLEAGQPMKHRARRLALV